MGVQKRRSILNTYSLVLAGAAILWLVLFRYFILTPEAMVFDAGVYYEHVKFYLDNITRGVYPLWDPFRDQGTANFFFLRRIGELNPLYWTIPILHMLGLSMETAYKIFLAAYFLTGIAGFHLLARRLFADPRAALAAALLLMFSSLGLEVFSSYIILMAVPGIWFFYFLTAFVQTPARVHLLGASFCVMLLFTTYIPFFFMSVLGAFCVCFLALYGASLTDVLGKAIAFCRAHKVFALLCAVLVAASLLPGALWYVDPARKEFSIIHRADGMSVQADKAHVALGVVNEGGINTPLIIDSLSDNLEKKKAGDFYVPVLAFLLVLAGGLTAVNRRQVLIFAWGLIVYLIGSADACPLHAFLYKHVVIFKFFRNLHFYLPMVVLPLFVLFAGGVLDAVLREREQRAHSHARALFIVAVHVAAALYFAGQESGMTLGTAVTIAASAAFFLAATYLGAAPQGWTLVLLAAAALAQPIGVLSKLDLFHKDKYFLRAYEGDYAHLKLPTARSIEEFMQEKWEPLAISQPYFASPQFHELYKELAWEVISHYLTAKFLLYDRIEPFDERAIDYNALQERLANFPNAALVPADQIAGVPLTNAAPALPRAGLVSADSPELNVLRFDVNDMAVRTRFQVPKFVVYNANYNPGWRVYCDGRPLRLLRSNLAFQGVWVPEGEHVVEWHFGQPWQYALGYCMIGLFGGVFLGVIWLACRQRT